MSTATEPHHFPRPALHAAAAIIVLSIAAAAAGRFVGAQTSVPVSTPVISRELRFLDAADGSVLVRDAQNADRLVATIPPETNGFLRATVRGLARQRLREHDSIEAPFRLTQWADGRLTLEDAQTGRHVEMEAFGPDNAAAFARLITAGVGR